jgi:hypothetical protein
MQSLELAITLLQTVYDECLFHAFPPLPTLSMADMIADMQLRLQQ